MCAPGAAGTADPATSDGAGRIVVVWRTDPKRPGTAHIWHTTEDPNEWESFHPTEVMRVPPDKLSEPAPTDKKCIPCILQHGDEMHRRQEAARQRQREAMRKPEHWKPER